MFGQAMVKPLATLFLALVILFSGCAKIEQDKKAMAIEASTQAYATALRWGYFETAQGYLHPERRAQGFDANWGNGVRVVGYEVARPLAMSDAVTANQSVLISYLHQDVQRVRTVTDHQIWRYDEATKAWWLDSALPVFE
ncbi:hypothetical protein ABC977_05545 [Thioalkalicoccus limnaeus]|uniref:Uncharacterized protein n=1 Tax=Thioalkalicoccus limnaeus TaxID=120681 RepID=A0ABV4BC58_9GAMM